MLYPERQERQEIHRMIQIGEYFTMYAELEDVNYATNINVSDSRLEQVRGESRQDPNMQVLMNLILSGWPEEKTFTPLHQRILELPGRVDNTERFSV